MSHPKWELIKFWRHKAGFTLRLYYLDGDRLYYVFKDGKRIIFEGKDYRPSPMHSHDSLDAVYGLLSFLSIQEGDTEPEYFKDYTDQQLEWTRSMRCQDLAMIVFDWEERNNKH
jgi:hypothetical protein